jgi:Uma2 family endonuclease
MGVAEPRTRRWTRAEYYKMADMGLFEGQRVELIDGEIIEMSPQKGPHAQSIGLTSDELRAAFGRGHWVREQLPLALGLSSDPEPDVSVVRGTARDYPDHPTSALLVVEVSDSSLGFDRSEKASLYAQAGIAEYWVLNLVDRQLEVRRSPVTDTTQPHGFGYADMRVLKVGESISPLAAPQATIAVRDLLP